MLRDAPEDHDATELNGRTPSAPEQVIVRIIDSGGEGHDQKVIGWLGDAAAVIVTKHLPQRHLSRADIDMTLMSLSEHLLTLIRKKRGRPSTEDNVARLALP
jgi:hypothetical protein